MDINKLLQEKQYLKDDWDLSNETLYSMCREYSSNCDTQSILAKSLIIGRTYAVALERRKSLKGSSGDTPSAAGLDSDRFYKDYIVRRFKEINLDEDLEDMRNWTIKNLLEFDETQIKAVLSLHSRLSKIIEGGVIKRSFASKYLHFHLPDIFFIYDSRAVESIKFLSGIQFEKNKKRARDIGDDEHYDLEYKKFYYNCLEALRWLKRNHQIDRLDPRQFDNLLMAIYEEKR
ncbi:hypothetical protein ACFOET_18515 [Parapedobacter deserti]|uniref:AbiV family abortive infection protein n=2 Tax=Parapedobacter deserti TaxID=1912957 RepID=A0ABV7JWG0_9SPHI